MKPFFSPPLRVWQALNAISDMIRDNDLDKAYWSFAWVEEGNLGHEANNDSYSVQNHTIFYIVILETNGRSETNNSVTKLEDMTRKPFMQADTFHLIYFCGNNHGRYCHET